MIVPNDTDYEYNSTILFKCKMGFSLKGSQNATCHQNASFWFIGGTPKCEGNVKSFVLTPMKRFFYSLPPKTYLQLNFF